MLEFQNLTKSFKARDAVSDISLTIRDGQMVGVIGPSGAG